MKKMLVSSSRTLVDILTSVLKTVQVLDISQARFLGRFTFDLPSSFS